MGEGDTGAAVTVPMSGILEAAVAGGADPADAFWVRYFAAAPDAAERMAHMDEHMRGRMLASVYDLLTLEADAATEAAFLNFEIGNHDAYGARLPMYEALFAALGSALRECCGGRWQSEWDAAWDARVDGLLTRIEPLARLA